MSIFTKYSLDNQFQEYLKEHHPNVVDFSTIKNLRHTWMCGFTQSFTVFTYGMKNISEEDAINIISNTDIEIQEYWLEYNSKEK